VRQPELTSSTAWTYESPSGPIGEDGATIAGRWELAQDGEDWKTDFDVTYSRVTSPASPAS